MAYAAAGSDPKFHALCYDIYCMYLPYASTDVSDTLDTLRRTAPGALRMFDIADTLDLSGQFPTIHEVVRRYSKWLGELPLDSKWNPAHFKTTPGDIPIGSTTMMDYMLEHSIQFPEIEFLF